jgi:hypothetical protein
MPLKKIDYKKNLIYKIVCNDLTIPYIFVGSTTDFYRKKQRHKSCCNNNDSSNHLYVIINDYGGWDNWSMIEIEKFPCNDSNETKAREHYHLQQFKDNLHITTKNKFDKVEYKKVWDEDNKEHVKNYNKSYYNNKKSLV